MSKASRSLREYTPDRKTVLIDKLRKQGVSLNGAKFQHEPLCPSSHKYFTACTCAVSVTVIDPATGETTTYN